MSYKPDVPRYDKCSTRGGDYVGSQYDSSTINCQLFLLEGKVK